MHVTLKTLQQQTFKIDVEPDELVKHLKDKIEKEKGSETFPAAGQKLIYAGKILDDDKTVASYKIEEKNFVVVMVTKPKPAPAAPAPEPTPAPVPQAAPVSQPVTEEKMEEKPDVSATSSATDTTASGMTTPVESASETATESQSTSTVASDLSATSAESALVTGQAYEDAVSQMVNMGFARDQVQRALRASFNNPDRAIEYLLSGIPDMPQEAPPAPHSGGVQQSPAQAPVAPAAPTVPAGGGTAPSGGTAAPSPATGTGLLQGPPAGSQATGEEALAFLRNQPQFHHMRSLIQRNPQLLPELLQQIGRSNPQLLQIISQNQEQFIAMLNEQAGEESAQGGGGGGAPGEGGPLGQPGGYIQVTQQEKEAIERLKALGFSEGMCIQAYFACEKNEELAANYLLSHGFDDEDS